MEYGLGLCVDGVIKSLVAVLILVLMEYGLGPCIGYFRVQEESLNPCFNGIWSRTVLSVLCKVTNVLILVLMEYGLGHLLK